MYCDAGHEKVSFEWCYKNSVNGPFMNAKKQNANCRLDRNLYFIDSNGKISANQAIAGGIDGVFYLMQRLPGDAGVQQPVAL